MWSYFSKINKFNKSSLDVSNDIQTILVILNTKKIPTYGKEIGKIGKCTHDVKQTKMWCLTTLYKAIGSSS